MIRRFIGITALAVTMALPVMAQAQQGVPNGVERGSRDGERAAGPVGGVIGGVVGGVNGILGVDQRPRFRSYAVEQQWRRRRSVFVVPCLDAWRARREELPNPSKQNE